MKLFKYNITAYQSYMKSSANNQCAHLMTIVFFIMLLTVRLATLVDLVAANILCTVYTWFSQKNFQSFL